MRNAKIALATLGACLLVLFVILSVQSSKQSMREHERQQAIRDFDEQQKRETEASQAAWRRDHPNGVQQQPVAAKAEPEIDVDAEIANLNSLDRDVQNLAIQRLQRAKACKALPKLLSLLKSTSDEYIAGISAEAIAECKDASTYDEVVRQFLERKPTEALIFAVGETETRDERAYAKLEELINNLAAEPELARFARHAKQEIDVARQSGR